MLPRIPDVAWLPDPWLWGLLLARMIGLILCLPLIPKTLGWRFRLALAMLVSWVLAASVAAAEPSLETRWSWEDLPLEFLLGGGLGLSVALILCGVRLCAEILELTWSPGESVGDACFGEGGAGVFGVSLSWLTAVIFVNCGGHLQVIDACCDMVRALPPGSLPLCGGQIPLLLASFQEATCLALRLAAPIWGASAMAMLVVAVLSRMFPVVSVVSAAIPWRAGVAWLALSLSIHGVAQLLDQEMEGLGDRVRTSANGPIGLSVAPADEVSK